MWPNKSFKKVVAAVLAVSCLGSTAAVGVDAAESESVYIPTNRDTKPAPERAEIKQLNTENYELLYETDLVRYYYREDRDIFAIEDKQSGYFMKTGADLPFSKDVKDAVKDLQKAGSPKEEILAAAESYADDLNATYVGIANSLLTIEYHDGSKVKQISSASEKNAESQLHAVQGHPDQYILKVRFKKPDIQLNVYITLGQRSISYKIPRSELSGEDLNSLMAIDITPFLGASGGRVNVLNEQTLEWETKEQYRVPGYVLVPDGSGALIRFVDNTAVFNPYVGDVYGKDYAAEPYYYETYHDDVPVNQPLMPVFGIAHGNQQMAFVAWADQGAEHMKIVVNPDETKSTSYTWAYPKFEYNVEYYQLYDEQGNGFFDKLEEIFDYDIDITYCFLMGDGTGSTPAADYAGMAMEYRQHLLDIGELTLVETAEEEIPIRLDFIMSDAESGIIGNRQVTVTTVDDVRNILLQVSQSGIRNINSGLIGWQKKGESLNTPDDMNFSWRVGRKKHFQNLFQELSQQNIDVSFARDMTTINKEMTGYYNTAVKCVSDWYATVYKEWILPDNIPVSVFSYATPKKATEWFRSLTQNVAPFSDSFTASGISNILTSNYNHGEAETTLEQSVALYRDAMEAASAELKLNLVKPNMYLWKYTDRYLQMPVGNSQYIYETDAVPFLQMVLRGTMEMYAPYSNFSFYTQECILRMIDYNVSPSFILSQEPSWKLMNTFSANLYSTEYALYEDMIQDIYGQINDVLGKVNGYTWVKREAPANGVVVNTYVKDGDVAYVVINYTDNYVTAHGVTVKPQSAAVVA